MSEMSPVLNALRDELLKQNGRSAVDEEVGRLRAIVASQQRRARRLTIWTIGVWAVWLAMLTLSLGLPFLNKVNAPPPPPRPDAAGTTAPHSQPPQRPAVGPVAAVISVLLFPVFVAAPFVGIVLTVMMVLARRTAGMSEIRASLASIDTQLRLLAMSRQGPPPPPPPAHP